MEVDPQRIKFNPHNPNKHTGSDFDRLMQSVKEVGIVQLPSVRILPGGFYEAIDGEGRVKSAQAAHIPKMMVVNFGQVSDDEAFTMLQSANAIRSFGLIAECRGMAQLYNTEALSEEALAKKFGVPQTSIKDYIAVGNFPEDLLAQIEESAKAINTRERGEGIIWGVQTLRTILKLRQVLPGKGDPRQTKELADSYDYTEVRAVVDRIVRGDILTRDQLAAYIERRRREIFEEHVNQEIRARLDAEIEQTRKALEEGYSQQLAGVEQKTAQRYEAQVHTIQTQYTELQSRHDKLVKEVARRPEIIEQRKVELDKQLEEASRERRQFQALQQQVQSQAEAAQKEAQRAIEERLAQSARSQEQMIARQLEQTKADMEAYYAKRDAERQLKAETSLRQSLAHGTQLLTQVQQSFLHIMSPGYIKGIPWLSQEEIASLLAQLIAVQRTLDESREAISEAMRGTTVSQDAQVIEEGSYHG